MDVLLGCSRSSSVDCAKGGLDGVRETITAQVMTDPQVCHCYKPRSAPHVSLRIKCSVTPAHSHTKD